MRSRLFLCEPLYTYTEQTFIYMLHVHIYKYMHVYYMHVYRHVHISVHIYVYLCICACIRVHMCGHMYKHILIYIYVCICSYTCTIDMLQALCFLKQEEAVVVPLSTYLLLVICVGLGFRDSGCRTVVVELSWLQLVMPYTVRNQLENVEASTRQVERGHGNPAETHEIVRESYKARTLYHPVNLRNAVLQ